MGRREEPLLLCIASQHNATRKDKLAPRSMQRMDTYEHQNEHDRSSGVQQYVYMGPKETPSRPGHHTPRYTSLPSTTKTSNRRAPLHDPKHAIFFHTWGLAQYTRSKKRFESWSSSSMPEALLKDPILDPVMKRRTENRLPTLEGARCHGPGVGVPGVLMPEISDCLGLLLLVFRLWWGMRRGRAKVR